ncbi:MAG: M48 family metallopeptidase [Lautropia sp.]
MMPACRDLALACATGAALLAGCASSNGVVGEVTDAVAGIVLPPEQAAQLGDRLAAEVDAKYPRASPTAQQRVDRIGRQLLASADTGSAPFDFEFTAIEQPGVVNAFALPGGHIYVTTGLLQLAETDAELASVIGHEIAHVTERHIAERMASQYGVQLLASAALGQNPGVVSQLAGSVVEKGLLMRYSRSQELDADRVGVRTMRAAGYDPQGAVSMFRDLEQASGDSGTPEFLSSHPSNERRIERIQAMIAEGS